MYNKPRGITLCDRLMDQSYASNRQRYHDPTRVFSIRAPLITHGGKGPGRPDTGSNTRMHMPASWNVCVTCNGREENGGEGGEGEGDGDGEGGGGQVEAVSSLEWNCTLASTVRVQSTYITMLFKLVANEAALKHPPLPCPFPV